MDMCYTPNSFLLAFELIFRCLWFFVLQNQNLRYFINKKKEKEKI